MRTGIYGGTFNPIHTGHVRLVKAYQKQLELDRVLIIPTCVPPHKAEEDLADGQDRLEMCRLAFLEDQRFQVDDLELRRGEKSYTVDTLEALHNQWPEDTFYLIMGSDMFLTVTQWKDYERIFQLAVICAGARELGIKCRLENWGKQLEYRYGTRWRVIDFSPLPISSTQIRQRIRCGESVKGLVPDRVAEYLHQTGLYTR